jgi:high mobility group AT-hook protein 2
MPKKVYVPTGRPRGRPPGGGKKAAATPKKVAAVNDDGTPKRGRGRPRREAAANDEESAATTPKEPKKRGRKPKTVSPAADASADEDKDDSAGKIRLRFDQRDNLLNIKQPTTSVIRKLPPPILLIRMR